jgi:hypothetical protein
MRKDEIGDIGEDKMRMGKESHLTYLLGVCIGGEVRCRRAECSEQAHFLFWSKMTAQSNTKCAQTRNIDIK